jgi:coproporphyrinogen III oxidase
LLPFGCWLDFFHWLSLFANLRLSNPQIDGGKFLIDKWERAEGGGGVTTIIQDSTVLEKGGTVRQPVYLPPGLSPSRMSALLDTS